MCFVIHGQLKPKETQWTAVLLDWSLEYTSTGEAEDEILMGPESTFSNEVS